MIAAGTPPDIFHVEPQFVSDLVAEDFLHPFNDFEGADKLIASFAPRSVSEGSVTIDGLCYALPVRSNSIEYFYNVDHFEEVGLDPNNPPKTWDEMMDAAIKLTKKDSAGNTIRYGCDVGFWSSNLQQAVHYWSSVFWSYGGNYLENGKAGFNTEAGVKACQYWYDMVNVHGVSPVDQVDGGFESGAISMVIGGEWNIAPFDAVEGLNYNIMTMPSAAIGKDPVIPMGGRYTAIPAASKHPAEAFEFISYIMSRDVQLKYTSTGIGLSGRADIEDDQFFIDNPKYKVALDDLQYMRSKTAPSQVEMNAILGEGLSSIMLGEADIKTTLDDVCAQYDALLAN